MKKIRKNFKSRLQFACSTDDLRPVMQLIMFKDAHAICTNAHIIIKQDLVIHGFKEDEIAFMEGKFIHRDAFIQIYGYDTVTAEEKGFRCKKEGVECFFYYSKTDHKFPNCDAIIPNSKLTKYQHIDTIGLNLDLFSKVKKIMAFENNYIKTVQMGFFGKNKGVLIKSLDGFKDMQSCVVMPVMLNL